MSFTQSLESKLKTLQSQFTWNLEPSKSQWMYLRDALEDVSKDEGNFWLGHVYNLQGFIQYKLGSSNEALNLFSRATETFQRLNNADKGPWLVVNFGNLAWIHHLMGEDEKSRDYLSKVDDLMKKYPAPPEEELHPEVCAEKAWTLMKFDKEKKQQAAELFQRAIRIQPDIVEWQSNFMILSTETFEKNLKKLYDAKLETLRSAKERDPDNLCVAALYLEARLAYGEQIQDEARVLAEKLEKKPSKVYIGISPLLRLHRKIKLEDDDESADETLTQTPKRRSEAQRLTKKILYKDYQPVTSEIQEAIRLWAEVIDSDPESNIENHITMASIHAKVDKGKADQIYQELLDRNDLNPAEKQILYNRYAKYLYFIKNDSHKSTEYHMKVAEIPENSIHRQSSITELEKTLRKRNGDAENCTRIKALLTSLRNPPETQNQ